MSPLFCIPSWDLGWSHNLLHIHDKCYHHILYYNYPITDKHQCFHLGFPCGSAGKESACNAGDPGSDSGFGRSPGEGNGKPLQYSCLENSMDRGGLQSMGSQKSQTRLSTHTGQDIILHVWPQMECWSWEMLSLKIILQETLYPYFLKFRRVH